MNHWLLVSSAAEKVKQHEIQFESPFLKNKYSISKVAPTYIKAYKHSVDKPVILTDKAVNNACEKLKLNGSLNRKELLDSSVKNTMLAELHPNIFWKKTSKKYYWKTPEVYDLEKHEKFVANAPEDQLEKMERMVLRRMYQSQFRKNLLKVYKNACCISGCRVERVLQASHIVDFAISGNNNNDNGLLLRADLHILFDAGLFLIHPINYTTHFHSSINQEYEHLNNTILKSKFRPATKNLLLKWNENCNDHGLDHITVVKRPAGSI